MANRLRRRSHLHQSRLVSPLLPVADVVLCLLCNSCVCSVRCVDHGRGIVQHQVALGRLNKLPHSVALTRRSCLQSLHLAGCRGVTARSCNNQQLQILYLVQLCSYYSDCYHLWLQYVSHANKDRHASAQILLCIPVCYMLRPNIQAFQGEQVTSVCTCAGACNAQILLFKLSLLRWQTVK